MFLAHGNGPNIPHRLDTEPNTFLGRVEQGFGAVGSLPISLLKSMLGVVTAGVVPITDGATLTIDASLGNVFTLTMGASRTIPTPINLGYGIMSYVLTQDGTGGWAAAWASSYKWPNGQPILNTTIAGASTVYAFVSDGTSLYYLSSNALPSAATYWDPTTKHGNITISGGGYTVTTSATSSFSNAKSTKYHSSGKYYVEFVINTIGSTFLRPGFLLSTAANNVSVAGVNGIAVRGDGIIETGGVTGVDLGTPAVNDVFRAAIDITTGNTWFALNAGTWNNSGSADPATGAGSIVINGGGGQSLAIACDPRSNSFVTFRPLQSQWTYTAPTGFVPW